MSEIAALALRGAVALQAGGAAGGSGSWWQLGELMAANFSLRRRLYGDAVVGAESIAMVEAAKCIGAPAKLTGSGGAVVAVCPGGETQAAWLQGVCDQRGFACEAVRVGPVLHEPGS